MGLQAIRDQVAGHLLDRTLVAELSPEEKKLRW